LISRQGIEDVNPLSLLHVGHHKIVYLKVKVKVKHSLFMPGQTLWVSRSLRLPEVRLSALPTSSLYPKEIFLVLMSVRS
jgi:hypothetical protein